MDNIGCAINGIGIAKDEAGLKFSALSFLTDLAYLNLLKEDDSIRDDYKKRGVVNLDVIFNAMDKATQKEPITIISHVIGEVTLTNSDVKKLYKALKGIKIKEPAPPNLFATMI